MKKIIARMILSFAAAAFIVTFIVGLGGTQEMLLSLGAVLVAAAVIGWAVENLDG